MKRRTFLQTSLHCAAVAVAPLSLAAAGNTGKPRIPIGFLGATYSHGPAKIKLALSAPDWECVGVCESSAAGRTTCEKLGAQLVSQDDLFARACVVAVESDVRDHAPHALLALKANKHVHVEKPPATQIADMRAMVALAREKERLLQTGFMWRYHPGFKAILEAARQGWLGDIFMVRGFIGNNLAPARRPEWGEYPGGSMFDLGSHLVDFTVRLLGRPKTVAPLLRHHGKFNDSLRDNNVAVLEYDHATAVLVNTAMQAVGTPQRSLEVLGTNGTATLQPIEPPALILDLAKPSGPYKKGSQQVSLPTYQRYEADFAELAAAVRGERPLSVSLDEELLVAETVLRVSDMPSRT
jgi:predicted dehydrogenase